ncbi:MAG: DUF433 domain-containing protein [Deltaproteobacteria bacterium]|nr:DUF433 domain-containing protein [Deltaproteobacteria bacterium]
MAETFVATGLAKKESWSANEASCVTGIPLKQVHRIIDAGLLGDAAESRNGARVVLGAGLIGLKLAYQLGTVLTPEGRRRLIRRLLDEPAAEAVYDEPLSVDLRVMAETVFHRVSLLAEAKRMVETDDNVLGGAPCFKGTRIPVHDIAAMLANGDSIAALQAAYPRLTEAQISAAPIYTEAYPRRGRRRNVSPSRRPGQRSSFVIHFDDLPPVS